MTSERRYTEEEVAEILDRATETRSEAGQSMAVGPAEGMTLAELHEIGEEVGIPKELITRAATSLDRPVPDSSAHRKLMGMPIGVGRTVTLSRPLTDQEWNRLVVDLRTTFNAKGKLQREGAFRQWSNGNLQALLEPTESGEQLRLRTLKGNALPYTLTGGALLTFTGVSWLATALAGNPMGVLDTALVGLMGAALFAYPRLTVPGWARTRAKQMEDIIARLTDSIRD